MLFNREDFFQWMFKEAHPFLGMFLEYDKGIVFTDGFFILLVTVFIIISAILFVFIFMLSEDKKEKDLAFERPVLINGTDVDVTIQGWGFLFFIGLLIVGGIYFSEGIKKTLLFNSNIYEWKSEAPEYLEKYLNQEKDDYYILNLLDNLIDKDGKFHYCLSRKYYQRKDDSLEKEYRKCLSSDKKIYKDKYIASFINLKKDIDNKNKDLEYYDVSLISEIYEESPFINSDKEKSYKYKEISEAMKKDYKRKKKKEQEVKEEADKKKNEILENTNKVTI